MSRTHFNELLLKALASPDFQRAAVRLAEVRATRPVRPCRCVVAEIPETAKPDDFAQITPGTVTAFVAREGEPLLRTLTEAVETGNGKAFNSVTDQIEAMAAEFFDGLTASALHAGARTSDLPSFAEISYANKTLISHIHVDDVLRVHAHPFPYNGGHLNRDGFSMLEYYGLAQAAPLTCVLLVRQPRLSNIEKDALRLVPSGSAANLAPSPCEPLTPALLAIVVAATPYAAQWLVNEFVKLIMGGAALASISDEVLGAEGFTDKLKSLPPEVSAAELVRLRMDMLLEKPPV